MSGEAGGPIAPREAIAQWLARAAARDARQRLVRDLAWAVAALLALAAGYAAIARLVALPPVVAALLPLISLAAAAVLASLLVRRWQRPSYVSMAARADARAALHDSLLSAYSLSGRAGEDRFVDLHLQRVAQLARGLDVRHLFPLQLPRGAAVLAGLALLVAGSSWMLPRPDASERDATQAVVVGALRSGDPARPQRESDPAAGAGMQSAQARLWANVDALAAALAGSSEGQSLAQAIAARDARAAARALQDLRPPPEAGEARRHETPEEQMSDALAQGILERLAELIAAQDGTVAPAPGASGPERPTARLDSELRAEQEDAQRAAAREQSAGEEAINTSLRALSRNSAAGRDMVRGEAESAQGAGRATMGGGAMGRRVGVSTAGAGEGDQPGANVAPLPADDTLLGEKTQRLAVQLRTVKMPERALDEREAGEDQTGTQDASYAATRAQAARTALQAAAAGAGSDAEAVSDAQASSLEFRDAIKRYTLARHRHQSEAAPANPGQ